MTRDDMIRMARESGWEKRNRQDDCLICGSFDIERFAALVAAAEREKAAKWLIQKGYSTGHGDTIEDLLEELVWLLDERVLKALRTQAAGNTLVAAVEAEREECAKVCEELVLDQYSARGCANAIRARGQA